MTPTPHQFSPQQLTAIQNPCEFPMQCANQQYRRVANVHGKIVSTVLTVNVGEE